MGSSVDVTSLSFDYLVSKPIGFPASTKVVSLSTGMARLAEERERATEVSFKRQR